MTGKDNRKKGPFIVCKAAAGSGKTFTLVLEYLKMALAGPAEGLAYRFRGILAITFTNKAANEMKQRIMTELERMSRGVDPTNMRTMGARVLAELHNDTPTHALTPEQLQQRAAELYSAMLHHYTDLSVFTIDSFMHRIVRTFAHDLGQPVNFEVMLDKKVFVSEAVEQLMSLVGTEGNEELTRLLKMFADSNMESDREYNVEGNIKELANLLFDEDVLPRLKSLAGLTLDDFKTIQQRYVKANRDAEQRLKDLGREMCEMLEGTGLSDEHCYHTASGFAHYFRDIAAGEWKEPNSYVTTSMTGGKMFSPKCPADVAERVEALRPQLEQGYEKVVRFLAEETLPYNTRNMLMGNLYATALLGHLYRLLNEYSRQNEVLHLSEFNRMINKMVEDEDNPAPFIFERLGNRYHHFLIDEFQDTSVMQWHNLVPLVENGVSQGYESLVVGDAKQAIYRFRQGDVRQFVRLPKVDGMLHHGATLGIEGNSTTWLLDTNYRTAKSVVQFNNDFFSWVVRNRFADSELAREMYIGSEGCQEGDEELRQKADSSLEGHVVVTFVDAKEQAWVYDEVMKTIQMLVAERGYSYSDIMVLARYNSQLARFGAYLAANSDIPQTSGQSFLLRASDAAMSVVAALRYLVDRNDRVAAAEVLQRLASLGIVASNHNADMIGRGAVDLPHLLSKEGINLNPDYLMSLDLYDCCEELVRELRLDGVDMPYVGTLLDCAAAFAARHCQQIVDFLEWIDDNPSLSASTSDKLEAVRLMTVHKAKGLEAPVVICMLLPPLDRGTTMWVDIKPEDGVDGPQLPTGYVSFSKKKPSSLDDQWEHEKMLCRVDELNVLYVALTRPREQLYLVCQQCNDGSPALLRHYLGDSVGEDGRFDCGDAGWHKPVSVGDKDGKTVVALRQLSFADWTTKISIASPAEKALTPLLEDKVRFGIYAHELMSNIIYAKDVDAAVAAFRQSHDIAQDEMAVLERMARAVVVHPEAGRFFAEGNRVANEVSMMDGGVLGRPDRVVFADGETWVVDFKTGTPVSQNVAQVKAYCHAVAAMGYPNVSGWLIYLSHEGVEKVDIVRS